MRRRLLAVGIHPTPQRLAIGKVLLAQPQHLTADQVYDQVRLKLRTVSRATVYNTLRLFTEKGLLREIFVDAGSTFYDSDTRPHYHLYDTDKGALVDIKDDRLLSRIRDTLPTGVELKGIDLVVRIRGARP